MASELQVGKLGLNKSASHTLDIDGDVNVDANHKLRWGGGNAEIIGDGSYNLEFKTYDGSATTTKLKIDGSGNLEQHTDQDGLTKFVIKNEDTGTSARAFAQLCSDSACLDISANSAAYNGVAGWGDSATISSGSGASGGLKVNAVAGGVHLQTGQTTRLTIDSTGLATFSNGITVSGGLTSLGSFSEVTISGGGITVTSSTHRIDTQNDDSSDQLSSISGGTDGSILVLQSVTSTRDVTITHSNGTSPQNIRLAGGVSFTLDSSNDVLVLVKYGSNWREVSRSNNS